jgi:hypothetical protein
VCKKQLDYAVTNIRGKEGKDGIIQYPERSNRHVPTIFYIILQINKYNPNNITRTSVPLI